jgi:hypothetical protein
LLSDVTSLGLHRKVVARKEDIPNVVGFLQVVYQEAGEARVHWWLVHKDNGYFYLWIVWKGTNILDTPRKD